MLDINLSLKGGFEHIGNNGVANTIEANLKEYFDWALLNIGGYTNISIPTSGIYGGDFSILRQVADPNFNNGQVWESRRDWVWQTGINYIDTTGGTNNPLPVSVTVNGISNTGLYVNYPEGKIVFNTPVSGTVKANYSYRNIQLYRGAEAQWWREIQENSYRVDSNQYAQTGSGAWSVFSENRVQLPAVIIESVPRGQHRGVELGGQVEEALREVEFTILADNRIDRNNIMDIFAFQTDRKLKVFDINRADYPLDYRGMLTGTKQYPNWITDTQYLYRSMRLANSTITEVREIHPKLHIAKVRTTVEIWA